MNNDMMQGKETIDSKRSYETPPKMYLFRYILIHIDFYNKQDRAEQKRGILYVYLLRLHCTKHRMKCRKKLL